MGVRSGWVGSAAATWQCRQQHLPKQESSRVRIASQWPLPLHAAAKRQCHDRSAGMLSPPAGQVPNGIQLLKLLGDALQKHEHAACFSDGFFTGWSLKRIGKQQLLAKQSRRICADALQCEDCTGAPDEWQNTPNIQCGPLEPAGRLQQDLAISNSPAGAPGFLPSQASPPAALRPDPPPTAAATWRPAGGTRKNEQG